jgi:transposase-like protein
VAANTEGRREIVGLGIGPSEAETFWADFLKRLTRRGLRGVKLTSPAATQHGRVDRLGCLLSD